MVGFIYRYPRVRFFFFDIPSLDRVYLCKICYLLGILFHALSDYPLMFEMFVPRSERCVGCPTSTKDKVNLECKCGCKPYSTNCDVELDLKFNI